MSQSTHSRPQRKKAVRIFAPELNNAGIEFKDPEELETHDSRAPNYLLLPTGDRASRVLMVGTLTETTAVSEETMRARVIDATGEAFFVYAGDQYNKEEYTQLKRLDTPQHLMVIGKPNTYTTDEGETNVSVDPEDLIVVDEPTRERWEAEAAEFTLDRIEAYEDGTAPHFDEATTHYEYNVSELREYVGTVVDELAGADAEAAAGGPDAPDEESPAPDVDDADIDPEASA